jgi:predicted RNA-binding Zn-ribbon protein involved in translation (DUF1610 family)
MRIETVRPTAALLTMPCPDCGLAMGLKLIEPDPSTPNTKVQRFTFECNVCGFAYARRVKLRSIG